MLFREDMCHEAFHFVMTMLSVVGAQKNHQLQVFMSFVAPYL